MSDPYQVLGISKSADEAAIKRAFRKLAKENHPDKHGGDDRAKERFSKINNAYEILKDKDRRASFDRGEIDADGNPRFTGYNRGAGQGFGGFDPGMFSDAAGGRGRTRSFQFGGGDVDDVLSSFFTGAGRGSAARDPFAARATKGNDIEAVIAVTLEDIAEGRKPRVSLAAGKTVALNLPAGVTDGQVIRLKGQGEPSLSGGQAGDALVTVRLVRHPLFSAEGANLRLDLPISLDEAVLGGKITVPTLTGKVQLTVPPGSSSGKSLRLKGKGLPGKSGNGDLLVTLRIALPENADEELENLMKSWRAAGMASPRGPEFD